MEGVKPTLIQEDCLGEGREGFSEGAKARN
jgi:hypothetical protein